MSERVEIKKWDNGKIKSKTHYDVDGNRHGTEKQWFSDGKISYELNYRHDLWDGISLWWRKTGCLESIGVDRKSVEQLEIEFEYGEVLKHPPKNQVLFSKEQWKKISISS